MITRISSFFKKHHKIERFGFLFCALMVGFAAVLSWTAYKVYQDGLFRMGNQAIYNDTFVTSLTGVEGKVIGVYGNDDRTKSFILVQITDPSKLPADANDYEMYLTGYDKYMEFNPVGSIYKFGSSGYMGFMFTDPRGFSVNPQVLDLWVKSKVLVDAGLIDESKMNYEYDSAKAFDEFEIVFNPGAEMVETADFLNKEGSVKMSDIYEECVLGSQEEEIRRKLNNDLKSMIPVYLRMLEYEKRVKADGIILPQRPRAIRYDRVVKYSDKSVVDKAISKVSNVDVPQSYSTSDSDVLPGSDHLPSDDDLSYDNNFGNDSFSAASGSATTSTVVDVGLVNEADKTYSEFMDQYVSSVTGQAVSTVENKAIVDETDVSPGSDDLLYLATDVTVKGGWNLDWQSHLIENGEGFLPSLLGGDLSGGSYASYLESHNEEDDSIPFSYDGMVFYRTDGTEFYDSGYSNDSQIAADIDALKEAYSNFYSLKQEYQSNDIRPLFDLEMDKYSVDTIYSVNTNDDVLINWQNFER